VPPLLVILGTPACAPVRSKSSSSGIAGGCRWFSLRERIFAAGGAAPLLPHWLRCPPLGQRLHGHDDIRCAAMADAAGCICRAAVAPHPPASGYAGFADRASARPPRGFGALIRRITITVTGLRHGEQARLRPRPLGLAASPYMSRGGIVSVIALAV